MNKETITLAMTPGEADKVAYVLMAALHTTSMLDSERDAATEAANTLFRQLGYSHGTNHNGQRIEWPTKSALTPDDTQVMPAS